MRNRFRLAGSTLAAALLMGAFASPAHATLGCEGDSCPPPCIEGDDCMPPPPPPPTKYDLPTPLYTSGYSWVNLNGFQPDERHIDDGHNRILRDAGTRTYGNNVTGTTLTTTKSPLASATADSHSLGNFEGVEGAVALLYTVTIHAADQAAADALTAQLGGGATFATVRGNYTTAQSGAGLAIAYARTSGALGYPDHSFQSGCDEAGRGCGSGSFSLRLGFVSATEYLNGDPLDFIGSVSIEGDAFAGRTRYTDRNGMLAGTAYAFIDPLITLDPSLGNQYSLTIGGGQVANGTPGGAGAVPEPATWALMLGGFGLAGSALRRRRLAVVVA